MDEKNGILLQPVDEHSIDRPDFMDTVWELLTSLLEDTKQFLEKNAAVVLLYLALMGTPVMSLTANVTDEALYRETTDLVIYEDGLLNKAMSSLDQLSLLDEDWDGYGAPRISPKAIENCRTVVNQLDSYDHLEILPTEYGGVQVKKQLDSGAIISCDFGDESMSYYIEKQEESTKYFSFLDYSEVNVFNLVDAIDKLR